MGSAFSRALRLALAVCRGFLKKGRRQTAEGRKPRRGNRESRTLEPESAIYLCNKKWAFLFNYHLVNPINPFNFANMLTR